MSANVPPAAVNGGGERGGKHLCKPGSVARHLFSSLGDATSTAHKEGMEVPYGASARPFE